DAGLATGREQRVGPVAPRPVELAEDDALEGASPLDHTGLRDLREYERGAAEDMLGADACGDLLLVVDAVLERDHGGRWFEQWVEQGRSRLGVVRLHAEEDGVAGTDLGWIGARCHAHDEVLLGGAHAEAVLPDGGEVLAAGDETDVGTDPGELPAVETPDP